MLTKIKQHLSAKRVMASIGLVLLCAISMSHPLDAQTVTQGYGSAETLQRGMLVSLKDGDATKVEPADESNSKRLQGLVVNANDASVTLSSDGSKTFVATVGRYEGLVSDENGVVRTGDYISISKIRGIGMKASDKSDAVIGKALENFDGKSDVLSTTDLKSNGGVVQKVHVGRILLDIGIGANPHAKPEEVNLPGFLKRASEAIAQKPVSPVRVYISIMVFLAATVVAGSMLYAGVRSSMISIGRNPLSKQSIVKSMVQVIITSFMVFILGIFGVYLLLKL